VDVRCKVIRAIDLTTAKDHDINQLENLIDLKGTSKNPMGRKSDGRKSERRVCEK
jgi:hypothetical protein